MMNAAWSMLSPNPPRGAIAVFQFSGDISGVFRALRATNTSPGRVALRTIPDVDTVVVARFSEEIALVFPHAGPFIVSRLIERLNAAGIRRAGAADPRTVYPEARTHLEARMLAALARAASPLAIDLLLDQPRRWETRVAPMPPEASCLLRRLIDPPLVVALGAPNVGKSSLLNALAGRSVSIVADQPGTTRDHVGANLDLAGLVVRYIDSPGIGPSADDAAIQHAAQQLALAAAAGADLILLCGDRAAGFIANPFPHLPALRVALRSDLGTPDAPHDAAVSVHQGRGLEGLVAAIREMLVPAAVLADQRPWEFWPT